MKSHKIHPGFSRVSLDSVASFFTATLCSKARAKPVPGGHGPERMRPSWGPIRILTCRKHLMITHVFHISLCILNKYIYICVCVCVCAWFLFKIIISYDFATLDLMIIMPANGPCTLLSHIEAQTAGIRSRHVAIFRPLWDTIGSAPQMEKVLTRLNVESYCKFLEVSLNQHPCHWDHCNLNCFCCWAARIFLDLLDYLPTESHGEKLISACVATMAPDFRWPGGNSGNYSVQLVRCPGRDEVPDRVGKDLPGSNARVHVRRGSLIPWSKHFRFTALEPIPGAVEGGSLRGHHPQNLDDQYCHVVCCGSPCA